MVRIMQVFEKYLNYIYFQNYTLKIYPKNGEAFCVTLWMNNLNIMYMQGSTLRVNLWPQASKNSQKQLRASKNIPQLVLQGQ